MRDSDKDFIRKALVRHGSKYTYEQVVYVSTYDKVRITCPDHGVFLQRPNDHLNGYGCAKCSGQVSIGETAIAEWLRDQGEKVKTSVRKIKTARNPFELDIYLPEHQIAIEYNGVHWHSDKYRRKIHHQDKAKACYANGIRLIQFWDHDVKNKWPIVRSMIRNAIGKPKIRVYARHCIIAPVDPSVASKFFERNHLKGNAGASVHIGLWFDDTLVSCMTFSRPKFDKSYEWEIIRFASKRNYSVVGGASRLFTAFIRQYGPKNVMTYADLMTGTGGVYTALGMTQCGVTKPGYSWTKSGRVISRYCAQKKKLHVLLADKFDPSLSETTNMEQAGYYKLHDCGNAKFEWSNHI